MTEFNNNKLVPTAPKTYEVKYVENENKQSKLSPAARSKIINRSGGNYLSSWSETCIGETVGYGRMEKWCDKCNSAKDVSKNAYECPSCNAVFGAMIERNEEEKAFQGPWPLSRPRSTFLGPAAGLVGLGVFVAVGQGAADLLARGVRGPLQESG